MRPGRSFIFDFTWKVFVPSLAAAGAIALFLLHVINGIFEEANQLDRGYARQTATAAIEAMRVSVAGLAQSGTEGPADATFLVDPAGSTIVAKHGGRTSGLTARDFFGRNLDSLLAGGPPVFFLTGSDIALAAAAAKGPSIFIAVRKISTEWLAALSGQFALENLRFAAPGQSGLEILSASGSPIATLEWTDRRPGIAAQTKYRDTITAALTTFMFVVGLLIYMSWRAYQEAHEHKASAITASLRDDLTGLANRRSMLADLGPPLAALDSQGTGLSVVYADLDGFKDINDAYGHDMGDDVLRAIAAGFEFLAEGRHLVARFGSDEFAIVVEGDDHESEARGLAANIIAFLAEPMVFSGRLAHVAASIGIVHVNEKEAGAEDVLRRADVAMYAAKNAGRNRIQVYEPALDRKRDENRAIAHELRKAIEQRRLGVVYQPIVDARSRRIAGVEALVRWPQDAPAALSPSVFVPIAEEFGLIEDLGNFVLFEACRQAANWRDIFVSVNVSPIQFKNPAFAGLVEQVLKSTGLEAMRLEIEVTEGVVIDDAEGAEAIIQRLHAMHVSVALDDFGTGYSSIGHLRRFNFNKIKLDRSLVKDILHHPSSLRLVQGTIAMAGALGLQVTAEGIEDENLVPVLRLAGCNQFQGYLFSKPVAAADIHAMLNGASTVTGVPDQFTKIVGNGRGAG